MSWCEICEGEKLDPCSQLEMKKYNCPYLKTNPNPPPPPVPPPKRILREGVYILERDKTDFQVTLNGDYEIEFIHQIEKEVDEAINKLGFTRTGTSHYRERTEINYRQFGKAL